jgi:diacylglycerol kinase family enzyme
MDIKTQHVIANPKGGWAVWKSGASRATRTFAKQEDAKNFARSAARREGTAVFVHRADGTIRGMDTYERNPEKG